MRAIILVHSFGCGWGLFSRKRDAPTRPCCPILSVSNVPPYGDPPLDVGSACVGSALEEIAAHVFQELVPVRVAQYLLSCLLQRISDHRDDSSPVHLSTSQA
jgi:hypothetical protein